MKKTLNLEEYFMKKPFRKTYLCLLKRESLQDGIMPEWFTKLINWTLSD